MTKKNNNKKKSTDWNNQQVTHKKWTIASVLVRRFDFPGINAVVNACQCIYLVAENILDGWKYLWQNIHVIKYKWYSGNPVHIDFPLYLIKKKKRERKKERKKGKIHIICMVWRVLSCQRISAAVNIICWRVKLGKCPIGFTRVLVFHGTFYDRHLWLQTSLPFKQWISGQMVTTAWCWCPP